MREAPTPNASDDLELRRVAGGCYLAMRTGDSRYLATGSPTLEALLAKSLAATYANLCARHGIPITRQLAIMGMQLAAVNAARWERLTALLESLKQEGLAPVLFKGGVMHARWPAMRDTRVLGDYDLIVAQEELAALRTSLSRRGFLAPPQPSRLTGRLNKGSPMYLGIGLGYQNLDIHARVTEPPVCASLTRSILATTESSTEGVRIPDTEDCACMIALHIVRSGMFRPLYEYIDLLWYVDDADEAQWQSIVARARRHHLLPALFLSLRQAVFCLALDELAPERSTRLRARIAALQSGIGAFRLRALDWLAPEDYPLHPIEARNAPLFRRSLILGAGTSSLWRVCAAFALFGTARALDRFPRLGGKAKAEQRQSP